MLPQETSCGVGFLAFGAQGVSSPPGFQFFYSSVGLVCVWGLSLGGTWLDTELEFGLRILSEEVLPSILKWFAPSVICVRW